MDEVRLLVVEDEPIILFAVEALLEDAGFTVLAASNGKSAIDLLQDFKDSLRGLITDIRIPGGLNGWDVARRARELRPDLPVVYTTGDSAGEWAAQGVPQSMLLQKPYADAQLLTAISGLLNAGVNSAA